MTAAARHHLYAILLLVAASAASEASQCEDRAVQAAGLNPCDLYGTAIARTENVMVVGAPGADLVANRGGAAYVFEYVGGAWIETQTLVSSDPTALQEFGREVAFDGQTLMINGERQSTTTAGAVFVFEDVGGMWVETQVLVGSSPGGGGGFGRTISMDEDRAFIVAPGSAVHEFHRVGQAWLEAEIITEADIAPYSLPLAATFANRVAADSERLVIGHKGVAPVHVLQKLGNTWQVVAEITIMGQFDDFDDAPVALRDDWLFVGGERFDFQRGVAWAFQELAPNSWTLMQVIEASDGTTFARFGNEIVLESDRAFIAAFGDDEAEMNAGAVYELTLDGAMWTEKHKLLPSTPVLGGLFGREMQTTPTGLVVGAPGFIAHVITGMVHDVPLPDSLGYPFCPVNTNSSGLPALLGATGQPLIEYNCLSFDISQLPPGQFGYLLMGMGQGFWPLFGSSQGNLCISLPLVRFSGDILLSDGSGTMEFMPDLGTLPQSTTLLPGDTWNFQLWFRDVNPGPTSNTSNGLAVTFETTGDPAVQFPVTLLSVEEETVTLTVEVTLSQPTGEDVSIPYTTSGTATYNVDWRVEETNPIVIPAGETSLDMTIIVAEDTMQEGDETAIVTLGNPTGGVLGTASVFTLTIEDDD